MALSFRVKGFQKLLTGIEHDITFRELQAKLHELTSTPQDQIEIKFGFPPRSLLQILGSKDAKISNALKNRETLIVEKVMGEQRNAVGEASKTKRKRSKTKPTQKKKKKSPGSGSRGKRRRGTDVFNVGDIRTFETRVGGDLARAAESDNPDLRFLKNALSMGLETANAISMGSARQYSALANKFEFKDFKGYSMKDGAPASMVVVFRDISNKKFEETVDIIPVPLLKAVLTQVYSDGGIDLVRPYNISKSSPRIYWSLVKFFGSDIEGALKTILPDVQWEGLRTRRRKKSAKAIANEIQQQQEAAKRAEFFQDIPTEDSKKSPNKNPKEDPQEDPQEHPKEDPKEELKEELKRKSDEAKGGPEADDVPSIKKAANGPRKKRFRPGLPGFIRKRLGK